MKILLDGIKQEYDDKTKDLISVIIPTYKRTFNILLSVPGRTSTFSIKSGLSGHSERDLAITGTG